MFGVHLERILVQLVLGLWWKKQRHFTPDSYWADAVSYFLIIVKGVVWMRDIYRWCTRLLMCFQVRSGWSTFLSQVESRPVLATANDMNTPFGQASSRSNTSGSVRGRTFCFNTPCPSCFSLLFWEDHRYFCALHRYDFPFSSPSTYLKHRLLFSI